MTKFLHTCVRVKDLEASLKFYKRHLVSKKLVEMIFQNIQVSKTHEQRGREKCQLIHIWKKLRRI